MSSTRTAERAAPAPRGKDTGPRQGAARTSTGGPTLTSGTGGSQPRHPGTGLKGGRSEAESSFERLRALDKGEAAGDAIGAKGMQQLLNELGIAPDSLEMYTLLWRLGATRNRMISRSEWFSAMYTHKIELLMQLRSKVTEWVADVRQNRTHAFDLMYTFLYDYIRGEADRQMSPKAASDAWRVLFQELDMNLVLLWTEWITMEYKQPVSRDLWRQAWLYISTLKSGDTAADSHDKDKWPTAIDDFAAWRKQRGAVNVQ